MTSRLSPHIIPLISHKLGAVSQLGGAVRKRAASVPEARWAGSLAFSIQSPPRDCLTEGSSRARPRV